MTTKLGELVTFNDELKDNITNLKGQNRSLEKRIDEAFNGFEKQMKMMIKQHKARSKKSTRPPKSSKFDYDKKASKTVEPTIGKSGKKEGSPATREIQSMP